MIKICLVGGLGRMGRMVASQVSESEDLQVSSVWESEDAIAQSGDYAAAAGYSKNPVVMTSDGEKAAGASDVLVDFSLAGAFDDVVRVCKAASRPLVSGTTAIPEKEERLRDLAGGVPVVSAPNMSVGINAIFAIGKALAAALGATSDIEIVETHHRMKKDVPSGTALAIGNILASESGKPLRIGRTEKDSVRADEIFIHSLRMGDVPGTHTVSFSSPGETLEIVHTAQSRACFAAGVLRAVRFVVGAPPGLYSMLDVLGIGS
jgi:4-hydroxy-tetrahydrodipicolinate reductase